jgi:aryl-alcohol dehydrogenase-like predicted oxidoreductase
MSTSPTLKFEPRRPLGHTGFVATILGIGDLADRAVPLETCVATARRALEAGLNVIDTAPSYEDGYSEQIVGQALKGVAGRPRNNIFLIDKIDHHDQPVAPQVNGSLQRLGLEHVDLMVFHGLSTIDGWARVAGGANGTVPISPGGAKGTVPISPNRNGDSPCGMDQLAACVKAGKVRFRGISSHNPEVLRLAILSGLCDVVMFAVGPYVDPRYVDEILPLAKQHGVGTVCFKSFGAGKLVGDTTGYNRPLQVRPRGKVSSGGADSPGEGLSNRAATVRERSAAADAGPVLPQLTVADCVHYTLTQDPDVALLGLSFPNEQDAAFAAAHNFKPLSLAAMAEIRARAVEAIKDKGPCWWNPDGK